MVMDIMAGSAEMLAFDAQNDLLLKCCSSFKGCVIPGNIQPAAANVLP